jgi:hypothetical protein
VGTKIEKVIEIFNRIGFKADQEHINFHGEMFVLSVAFELRKELLERLTPTEIAIEMLSDFHACQSGMRFSY